MDDARLSDPYVHLTNNQINRRNTKGPRGGIRVITWTFAQLKQYLRRGGYAAAAAPPPAPPPAPPAPPPAPPEAPAGGHDDVGSTDRWDHVWEKIRRLVADTFRGAVGTLKMPLSGSVDLDLDGRQCFELFGLDVLIDAE